MELEANTSNEPSNNPTHEAVQFYWGERCAEHEDGCPTCTAWEHYDSLFNTASFVFDPERDGLTKFVPPRSLTIAEMAQVLNMRTQRLNGEQPLDKV